jgi:alanine racemase
VSPSNPAPPARAWADIDLGAIVANARTVATVSGARLLPMVKADGYGLGAPAVARALEPLDPWGYGVVSVAEALELRNAGIDRPILVIGLCTVAEEDTCRALGLRPAICDVESLRRWVSAGPAPFHLGIDTGMGRMGFPWYEAGTLRETLSLAAASPGWEGIFTHFHSADLDATATAEQWQRFQHVIEGLSRRPSLIHAANSAAALAGPQYAADLVRPGIFLYGGAIPGRPAPATVARLRAPVAAVRRVRPGDSVSYGATWRASRATTVATIAAGYADGLPRSLSNRGQVELNGALRPIIGRVTMDFTMVDLGDDSVTAGDVATVFGGRISLDEQAGTAGTISYELLTGLARRVTRRYENAR